MSNVTQISLNKYRQIQIGIVKTKRSDCANLIDEDVVKKLFFEKLDEVAGV